ncbi:MAG: ABC transporter permease [Phycisphaerales bacterium]|nr:ABC transporter permease [Phycisphaerales bacterium]
MTDQPALARKPAHQTSRRGTVFTRLFAHQESGLVLVILLLMAAMTIYGVIFPVKAKTPMALSETTTVRFLDADGIEHGNGVLGRNEILVFRVTTDGQTIEYPSASIDRYDSQTHTLYTLSSKNPFLNKDNLVLVVKNASFFAIMAVGMTGVIILAGIDLSVGSIYGFCAILGAMALNTLGTEASWMLSIPIGLGVCVLAGALCGFANGAMTVGFGVHPFVITLGMMATLRGLTVYTSQAVFDKQSIGNLSSSFTTGFVKREFFGVYPVPIIFMILVAIAGWFVLTRTVFGRRILAIGGNETAAKYAGIPVGRVKILVYTITGALAGLSAALYIGYLGSAETNAGNAYELQVIAATVIGGASLMGGRGTVFGAVLGAIIIQLINNAMVNLGVDPSVNQIVMGAAIILAVVIDQSKQRLATRRG